MTCARCVNWNLRKNPIMAKLHLGSCNKGPSWTFMPPHAKCKAFKEAPADVVEKRAAWLEKTA